MDNMSKNNEIEQQKTSGEPALCKKCYEFFGDQRKENLCSKCFKF